MKGPSAQSELIDPRMNSSLASDVSEVYRAIHESKRGRLLLARTGSDRVHRVECQIATDCNHWNGKENTRDEAA